VDGAIRYSLTSDVNAFNRASTERTVIKRPKDGGHAFSHDTRDANAPHN
jgi:hypothetical protein